MALPANTTVAYVWRMLFQHSHFFCKAHHSLLVLRNADSAVAGAILNSDITTGKHKKCPNRPPHSLERATCLQWESWNKEAGIVMCSPSWESERGPWIFLHLARVRHWPAKCHDYGCWAHKYMIASRRACKQGTRKYWECACVSRRKPM